MDEGKLRKVSGRLFADPASNVRCVMGTRHGSLSADVQDKHMCCSQGPNDEA